MFRAFLNLNISLSRKIDNWFPKKIRQDGNVCFLENYRAEISKQAKVIYDVGGGSQPFIEHRKYASDQQIVIGLDISEEELKSALKNAYDHTIVADICKYIGKGDGDIVVSQSTLEHVPNMEGAIKGIASCVKKGGIVYIFAPCRNALFARLNLCLPETIKRKLLFKLFPKKAAGHDGFKAYYDKCTPKNIESIGKRFDLVLIDKKIFWNSSYFKIFIPAYLLWRMWQLLAFCFIGEEAAETFICVLRKK